MALNGVRFYWRTEISVLVGTIIASAVLVGGLLVGDCVSHSLRRFALMRLGETRAALQAHGRFVDSALGARLEREAGVPVVSALALRGVVLAHKSGADPVQVNHVQVVGVGTDFWRLSPDGSFVLTGDRVALNRKLALQLGVAPGAEVAIRVSKPALMPRDAPLASRNEALSRRGSFTVQHVVPDDQLGRFSLAANQVSPYNVFVDIKWLQEALELPGRVNMLLVGAAPAREPDLAELSSALARVWKLSDVGIELRQVGDIVQLESDRIFLDPATSRAAVLPAGRGTEAIGVLTYLVNGVRKGERSTPYSFGVALGPAADTGLSPVAPEMRDDQVIINKWLANHLDARPGDAVTVSYLELVPGGGFAEREREFTVVRVASMNAFAAERELMPVFPGLTDIEMCREWDVGMPMDEAALRDEANEAYWEKYRATPKLAVTLKAGREMWANRFGDTTAIRYRSVESPDELRATLRRAMDPGSLGLFLLPVRQHALKAVDEAMSFGELFVAMSCFLIAAALMLTGMLFVFGIQQRAEEMGVLLGTGTRPARVRGLFLWEGAVVALIGSVVGGLLGMAYTRALIWGLASYWQGAVADAAIQYHAEPATLAVGISGSLVCAVLAMGIAMWRQTRRPARELLVGDLGHDRPVKAGGRGHVLTLALATCSALTAAGAAAFGVVGGPENAVYVFFGAGFLLLAAGLAISRLVLTRLESGTARRLTVSAMGVRNASRRGGRSITAVALLATGSFLVFAVSAMQQDLAATAHERWSGTGGFALFGESTLPAPDALETGKGSEAFGIQRDDALAQARFVSLKVRDGDDASCFNLNRAQAPRLVGVDPDAFLSRKAFVSKGAANGAAWSLLGMTLPEGVVPGLAGDANTAMWNLHKKVGPEKGDEIVYTDERGRRFRVKLVGSLPMPLSVFQGTVLISQSHFEERYPSEAGYRMFLVDVSQGANVALVQQALTRRMERAGLDVSTALARLQEFHGVEATYLNMFLVLGGLGIVLGTLGLGVVVMRNMLERRPELAILRCVGFSRQRIIWMVLAEHWLLLVMGLGCGVISAGVAICPSLTSPGMHVPVAEIAVLLGCILIAGLVSTALAVHVSMRGELMPALRKE